MRSFKIVLAVFAFIFIMSCEASCGPDLVGSETFDLGTPEQALDWISTHIKYLPDNANQKWQLPSETLRLGTGDCEDLSILFMSALNAQGIQSKLVGIKVDWYPPPSTNLHAVTEWNDQWYTVERGTKGGLPIGLYPKLWDMDFTEALTTAQKVMNGK